MNVLKADKSRFWITILLDDLPAGSIFEPGRLHLTVIPWFTTSQPDQTVKDAFVSKFSATPAFQLDLGPTTDFGPHKDVKVNLVNDSFKLQSLHYQALELFDEVDAHWAVKNPYVDAQYRPHIRRRANTHLRSGQHLQIRHLTLVKARRAEDNIRQVAERIELL